MFLFKSNDEGKLVIERLPELPSDYKSPEWKAYDQACGEAEASGSQWTKKQSQTYAAYHEAQKRNFGR